jgi:hypothetical protein
MNINRWVIAEQRDESRQGRKKISSPTHAFFRPSGVCLRIAAEHTVESVGYCLSSLTGLQNGVRRMESLFALAAQLEARLAKAQAQVDKLTPSLLAGASAAPSSSQNPNVEPASILINRIKQKGNTHEDAH